MSLAQPSETVWCVKLIALFSLMKLVPEKLVTYLGTACAPQKPESPMAEKPSLSSPWAQLDTASSKPALRPALWASPMPLPAQNHSVDSIQPYSKTL